MYTSGGTVKSVDVSELVFTKPDAVIGAAQIELGAEVDSVGYLAAIAFATRSRTLKAAKATGFVITRCHHGGTRH